MSGLGHNLHYAPLIFQHVVGSNTVPFTKGTTMSNDQVKNKAPWNKGKLVGQKLPLKLKEIWAIRVRLQLAGNRRDLAFNLAIDSKLRGSDLITLKVSDISNSGIKADSDLQTDTESPSCTAIVGSYKT